MNVLGVETATAVASVGLVCGAERFERRFTSSQAFRSCVPAIEALMEEAGIGVPDLDVIATPRGPGSFTGLRIGATSAVALTELHGARLVAPSTLSLVAEACSERAYDRVCASLDARRGRRYAAVCRRGRGAWEVVDGPVDIEPAEIAAFAEGAPQARLEDRDPSTAALGVVLAEWVARSGDFHPTVDPSSLELEYVRPGV